ncbi:hypothetical protein OS493_039516 [Desmophyllum pertusum]|uniref:Uncharacterized protein n=1 Tax=Desmophyllum pertusum TaxID=174260 RepID=A0A9X0CCE0_9CNID|nr:hypothetical protein OS493_039516 [Desmophyllum pertusum]
MIVYAGEMLYGKQQHIGCGRFMESFAKKILFSKNLASQQPVEDIFRQILEVIQHASKHVYASEGKTLRAAVILSGILHHVNSSTMASEHSSGKSDGIAEATQEIDGSMQVLEELLKHSGADILELLLRKLSTASLNLSKMDSSFAFLDLAHELFTFMTVFCELQSRPGGVLSLC